MAGIKQTWEPNTTQLRSGLRARETRERKGLSITQAAKLVGVSPKQFEEMERMRKPSTVLLCDFMAEMGVDGVEFLLSVGGSHHPVEQQRLLSALEEVVTDPACQQLSARQKTVLVQDAINRQGCEATQKT